MLVFVWGYVVIIRNNLEYVFVLRVRRMNILVIVLGVFMKIVLEFFDL